VRHVTVPWLGKLVVLDVLCMLIWPWPDPRSRLRSIWTSTIAHNSFPETDFRISFYESYHDSSNFLNVDISQNSNGHISVARDATVRWLGMLVVIQVLCMLIWLDPIQGQGHGAFEFRTISEAVHAGGDDRSPLAGLSGRCCNLWYR